MEVSALIVVLEEHLRVEEIQSGHLLMILEMHVTHPFVADNQPAPWGCREHIQRIHLLDFDRRTHDGDAAGVYDWELGKGVPGRRHSVVELVQSVSDYAQF